MTTSLPSTSAFPDPARTDEGLVTAAELRAPDAAAQAELVAAGRRWLEGSRAGGSGPEGILARSVLRGLDDRTVLAWSAHAPSRTDLDDPPAVDGLDGVEGVDVVAATIYERYRSFLPGGTGPVGCVVVITFETDGPEWQHRLVDGLFELFPSMTFDPGNLSNHFHCSTDGTRVLNYTEWRSWENHEATLGRHLRGGQPVPDMLAGLAGVRPQGFTRFEAAGHREHPAVA